MYGGTWSAVIFGCGYAGLSPRVRGNLGISLLWVGWSRSIPACTGEPELCHKKPPLLSVYPRVYGGTDQKLGFLHSV